MVKYERTLFAPTKVILVDMNLFFLGAKFGGYGSFLPTYERPCVRPDSKTPQRNYNLAKSPKNLHLEVHGNCFWLFI